MRKHRLGCRVRICILPQGSVRVEVEGSTSMLFAHTEAQESFSASERRAATKRAEQYATARDKAQAVWRTALRGKLRKRPREDPTAAPGADPQDATGQVSAIVAQVDAPQHPQPEWNSLIWPWQMGPWAGGAHHVVHRLAVGCAGVSPATRQRWSQSVRSWREPWLQIVWVYDAGDARFLDVEPHSHLLVRDASLVMPSAEWAEWQARAFPIPLIKDLFQLKCLHMFGGWWADMDYSSCCSSSPRRPPSLRRRHGC